MDRRDFLKNTLAVGAAASLARTAPAQVQEAWDAKEVAHLLPTANDHALLLKASFRDPLPAAPSLVIAGQRVSGTASDSQGAFWSFHVENLEPDTAYELQLRGEGGRPLCDPWPLRTFPHPEARKDHLRLLVYTCAGGHDALKRPDGKTRFVAAADRRRLLQRALSYAPDAAVSIGDHVYWDLRAGRSAAGLGGSEQAEAYAGTFDRTQPVLGMRNETVLKRAVGPQIADLYGTIMRSTPVFFYQDDHDYFENDHADDTIVTFPPDAFMLALGRASQRLYYPEFLPDANRPTGLAGSSAPDRAPNVSECYGTLRYGTLFEGLLYDCVRYLSLKGPSATFVEPEAETWLLRRMAESPVRHVVNMPSSPVGWTAGKWAEWYPDVLNQQAALSRDIQKPYWQSGWHAQHNRLLSAASARDGLPLFISGDIHSLGETHMHRYEDADFSKNPVVSVLSGSPGTGQTGWPSAFRGTRALPPLECTVDEKLPALEENGFILADFTPDDVTLRFFRWLPERGADAIAALEPFRTTVLPA